METCNGSCHCGRVSYQIKIPAEITVHRCNCSVCKKAGYLHLIVSADHFKLLSGEADLTDYRFHTGVARHRFCAHCGIKSFYIPRSHPDAFSVNLNCVDLPDNITVTVKDFDGQNWSQSRNCLEQDLA